MQAVGASKLNNTIIGKKQHVFRTLVSKSVTLQFTVIVKFTRGQSNL